ncbi:MAG: (p)ppGpp synthetase [Clostridiales bacterium]|nr:MAG: (p)ppGpp synthetase [Clostridiales bacterium]
MNDVTTEERAERLIQNYARYGRISELPRIREAFRFAAEAHKEQFRASGEPYISHPLAVAEIVIEMELDADSVISALLHDTVEDTPVTYEDIKARFGVTVADIVDGMTKLARIPYTSKAEQEMENLRKMLIAMARDIRVILIKLADRLHNVRTLDARPERKRREVALETMDVYSPIAHRLGITKVKWELEDLSLKYLDPIGYNEIVTALEDTSEMREELITTIKAQMQRYFAEVGLENVYIEGRVKHIYSIYRKMFMQNKTIDEVYDLYAVRVIVDTKEECYNILGLIHELYKPIPGRFKDYISTPKPNMYQSLHTTLIGRRGVPFEVQIRTWEMHHIAEYGVAAHWKYKQGLSAADADYEKKLGWIRQMLETQQDTDAEDFISTFKIDMFADEVYVFTPKGDVISLPAGATLIDFAYAIHSEVGNHMVGGKINNRIVTIDTEPQNGDIIEVLTSKASRGPSRDWLKIARTSGARSKIKQWFKRERREENIEQGRESLERELKRFGLLFETVRQDEALPAALKKLSFNSLDDLCAGIGYGGVTAQRAANRIKEECARAQKPAAGGEAVPLAPQKEIRRSESGVIVEGVDSCLVKFAHCCTPVPGDEIVGFVTRGYGVSVHCTDCANVKSLEDAKDTADRFVAVSWADVTEGDFVAQIEIYAKDRVALIADVTTMLANLHILIQSLQTKQLAGGARLLTLGLGVSDKEHLESVCLKLKRVAGVEKIVRSSRAGGEIV